MTIVPTPDLLIVTSSALPGTASFDQLSASLQFGVPALPVQETAAGARRSSRYSRRSLVQQGRLEEADRLPKKRFIIDSKERDMIDS